MKKIILWTFVFIFMNTFQGHAVVKPIESRSVSSVSQIKHPYRKALVQNALQYIGTPYKWGGTTSNGFDCSGFVQYVYEAAGLDLPRTAKEQSAYVKRSGKLAPGDLLAFISHGRSGHHVGIYIGNGWFIHSPRTGKNIEKARLDSQYFRNRFIGAYSPWK